MFSLNRPKHVPKWVGLTCKGRIQANGPTCKDRILASGLTWGVLTCKGHILVSGPTWGVPTCKGRIPASGPICKGHILASGQMGARIIFTRDAPMVPIIAGISGGARMVPIIAGISGRVLATGGTGPALTAPTTIGIPILAVPTGAIAA